MCACATNDPVAGSRGSFAADVVEYVRLAAALGARDPDSLDYGYAPPEWTADETRRPPPFVVIRARAMAAADRVIQAQAGATEKGRRRSLEGELRALAARADLLIGRRMSFDEESRALFGVTAPGVDDVVGRAAHAELDRLLPGRGPLVARLESFERRSVVPADKIRAVFERALAGCREHTPGDLPLPAGEGVEIAYVRDTPWNGYSRYRGRYRSTIQINVDDGFTVDGALALACHEGYPGHHVQNVLTEARLVVGRHFDEFTIQPLFSPQSLLAEALAVVAIDVAFPGESRTTFERDVLYPIAGIDPVDAARSVAIARTLDKLRFVTVDVARSYLDGDLEFVRAGSALTERAVVPQPVPLLKFFNRFRSYAITYTYGPHWLTARNTDDDDPRTGLLTTFLSPKSVRPTKLSPR